MVYPLVDDVVYDETNNRNPHRLASSEDSYLLFYGNHSMNYTSAFDELFLIVYSTDSISHGYDPFEFESGYKLTCNFEMEMVNTTNDYSQSFAFTHTGKIYNNQDEYWDDGEFHIYIGFKLEAGEVLDVVMHADAWISVVFFDGDNVEDIKITENKITHYSKWRGEFPVYNYDLGSGNFGISYKAPTSMSVNIAIYEYLYPADEFSYTFYSNINYTGGINNIGEIRDEFTEEAFIPWFFKNTLFGLISIYIISIKSKKLD